MVFGWIGLDQVPSPVEFAGIALVLAGVVLQERDEIPHPAAGEAPAGILMPVSVQICTTSGMRIGRGSVIGHPWCAEAVESRTSMRSRLA